MMENRECILAVDAGSTNLKAALVSYDGAVLRKMSKKTPVRRRGHLVQGSADYLYQATMDAVKTVTEEGEYEIKAVCIASQMSSFLCLDECKRPLYDLIYGIDIRGEEYLGRLEQFLPSEQIYRKTGCPFCGIYWPGKWLWMKARCPEITAQTRYLLGAKEYLLYKLTGVIATDFATASATQLYDQNQGGWWQEMLEFLEMDEEMLPQIKKPFELAGMLDEETAIQLGLPVLPVLIGCGDGPAATIASGAVCIGDCCISLGTTAVTRLVTDLQHAICPGFFTQCLYDGVYLQGIRINDSGSLAEAYVAAAKGIERPTEDVFILDGRFYPMEPDSDGEKLSAVLNSQMFQIYEAMLPVVQNGGITRIFVTGGGSKNEAYMQRISNLFEVPVTVTEGGASFAGLVSLALMYESKSSNLFEVVKSFSLNHKVYTPLENTGLKTRFSMYQNMRAERQGV